MRHVEQFENFVSVRADTGEAKASLRVENTGTFMFSHFHSDKKTGWVMLCR